MKRQVRSSVFETNSSSTHSIAISKAPVVIGKFISFGIGEFGWENDTADTADYLYTAILEQNNSSELLNKLKEILDRNSIEYKFEEPRYEKSADGKYEWLDYGYIDHGYELGEFLDAVLNDEDLLMRYLFGDSVVYTGNDNQDSVPDGCDIADEYCWTEDENGKYIEMLNPYHDSVNYDYYYKGN
jgi:hypothetical protein